MSKINKENQRTGFEVAVIGMNGRFPGAKDIHEFWENLKNGVESTWFLSEDQLKEMEVESALIDNPNYVKSQGGKLEKSEYFDAFFFGFTPKEAELMDPQMRILHECAWAGLEDAGYNPESYQGSIGVYTGGSTNFHWEATSVVSGKRDELGAFLALQLMDRGFLSTRISYKFNLRGPAITVQTACSTSLVAIHLACRGILSGECEMALAGGVSLATNPYRGYLYQEGTILSSDGHCRSFDAGANGTIGGEGAAVVILKSLEDAIADEDFIYAVIKGSAINNDGIRKVGFSAPSIEGQAEVTKAALMMAEVEPESISYIETHGTGTTLGDPVEVQALKLAFDTQKKGFCGLGSVKTNIGHLDAAAGAAGFIKTVLALKHQQIPPSLHFKTPNPKIDFENSPFYVVNQLSEWKSDRYPLRAGVNAFGIGGTNAHVILEEWPMAQSAKRKGHGAQSQGRGGVSSPITSREYQLILLSARTPSALGKMTTNLVHYFKQNPGVNFSDAAYTLQVGRKAFLHRRMLVCSDIKEAANCLASPGSEMVRTFESKGENCPAAFMFPGQGSQYINMGLQLYQGESVFKEAMDRCFEILRPIMGYDIKEILYPGISVSKVSKVSGVSVDSSDGSVPPPGTVDSPLERGTPDPRKGGGVSDINQTEIAQPLIFIIEYALAKLLMKWGIKPAAMIGHSIGEYTAACLAGVFSLEDALKMVALRGRLMQQLPTGAMLSVSLSGEDLNPLLNHDISLAAVNSPRHSVVSGPQQAVKEFETLLKKKGYQTRRLHTSHAFHSKMMDSILGEFGEQVSQIKLNKPQEPFLSNLTGQWIMHQQATDPAYWVKHLRHTVRFADSIREIVKKKISIFVEVGPGNGLSTLVRQSDDKETDLLGVNLLRHPKEGAADDGYLLDKIGQLWLYGVPINWRSFYNGEPGQRLPLPTYPFEGQRYWIDIPRVTEGKKMQKKTDMADWFYVPVWKQSFVPTPPKDKEVDEYCWLLFPDECGLGVQLANRLEHGGAEVILVRAGSGFIKKTETEYTINPANSGDYEVLLREVLKRSKPLKIIHLWGVTGLTPLSIESLLKQLVETQNMGIFSLVFLVQALGREEISEEIFIEVVTNNMQKVVGEEVLCPEKATLLGAVKVIAKEYPHLNCRSIDVTLPEPPENDYGKLLDSLFCELREKSSERMVAYRYNMRWVQTFEPVRLEETCKETARLRHQGVYLITGGLGGIGLEVAKYLAKSVQAKLVLTGRSPFPARGGWEQWFQAHGPDNDVSQKIQKLQEMEALGAEILVVSADVADRTQMQRVVAQAETCFGQINGIIHSAGLADYAGVIQRRSKETTEKILAAKVKGTLVLERVFKDVKLDFFILCSSLSSIAGPFGEVGYTAANAFLDAFAYYCNSPGDSPGARTVSINWSAWSETGMAVEAKKRKAGTRTVDLDEGILSAEGVEIFHRIIGANLPQVAVFTRDLNFVLEMLNKQEYDESIFVGLTGESKSQTVLQKRPRLSIAYAAPGNEPEQTLAHIWQDFFGIELIGINDDFFELGGDSLRAAALLASIHKEMNLAVPLTAFFNQPTIKGLTRYHAKKSREKSDYLSIEKAEEKEYYALSPAQKRLFILHQMEPERPVYNMPEVVVLEGDFDREIMERAFKELIRRHESLRTSFMIVGDEPVQQIHDEVEFKIEYFDSASHAPCSMLHASTLKAFIRSFDLSQAPLIRVGLINVGVEKYILMVDMHHIVSDGRSHQVLTIEFKTLYEGESLPLLKLQYKDFARWHNRQLRSGKMKEQEAYWLKEFENPIPELKLPFDFPRPAVQRFEGSGVEFELSTEQSNQLRELAGTEKVTMFILVFTLYNVFLSRLSGQEDIVVGTVIAGRRHADLESVIGMFVNTLALRNYPSDQMTFGEFLKAVTQRTVEAFENQDYQFEDVVEKVLTTRDASRNPLFDVMFTYTTLESMPSPGFQAGKRELNIRPYESESTEQEVKFDMILAALDGGGPIAFSMAYCTKLFKKKTIQRFANYFKEVVSAVLQNKEIELKDIKISHALELTDSRVYETIAGDLEF